MSVENLAMVAICNPEADYCAYTKGMEYLIQVVQDLSLARDLPRIMEIVRRAARVLTGSDGATFVLREGEQCYYADEDAIAPLWKGSRFPMSMCISGWSMKHCEPVLIEDVFADERIPADVYRRTFVQSLAMVPIRSEQPVGAIGNYWATKTLPTPEQMRLMKALAGTTAVALESVRIHAEMEQRVYERTAELETANREISRLSLTDELTGLYNRRGFLLMAHQQLREAHRSGKTAELLLADVDGLKSINDRLGHEAGDRLLTRAAQVLRETFREIDVVARIGGDEFVVFGTMMQTHDHLRQRLQNGIARSNRGCADGIQLSMSIGVVRCTACKDFTLEKLLNDADIAMYHVKRTHHAASPRPTVN